jgi:hypothetical protein
MSARGNRPVAFTSGPKLPSLAALSLIPKSISCDTNDNNESSDSSDGEGFDVSHLLPRPTSLKRQRSGESEANEIVAVIFEFDGVLTTAENVGGAPVQNDAFGDNKRTLSSNVEGFKAMTTAEHIHNFGGSNAVEALRKLFYDMIQNGVQPTILTAGGTRAAIDHALSAVELRRFFEDAEGKGELVEVFGTDVPPLSTPFESDDGQEGDWQIVYVINDFMINNEWEPENVLYVGDTTIIQGDTEQEIEGVKDLGIQTYPVNMENKGSIFDMIDKIRTLIDLSS